MLWNLIGISWVMSSGPKEAFVCWKTHQKYMADDPTVYYLVHMEGKEIRGVLMELQLQTCSKGWMFSLSFLLGVIFVL